MNGLARTRLGSTNATSPNAKGRQHLVPPPWFAFEVLRFALVRMTGTGIAAKSERCQNRH